MDDSAAPDCLRQLPLSSLRRLPARMTGCDYRVILLPFADGGKMELTAVFERVATMTDADVERELATVIGRFAHRHTKVREVLEEHYQVARDATGSPAEEDPSRRLLLGAYFTMEYSIESAALFNPSMVPHPSQQGLAEGSVRFLMSLRATGEGHVSSVVFETGVIDSTGELTFDPSKSLSGRTRPSPDQSYLKELFRKKLVDMRVHLPTADRILENLSEWFAFSELVDAVAEFRGAAAASEQDNGTLDSMLWLARSNYRLQLALDANISELVIFPHSSNESRGIEDLRLVEFSDDSTVTYYGTYTAYNGHRILPMLMQTSDFRTIEMHTLNGACVQNKGMALFPRRVNGHYTMCSRIDGRNLYIMFSDYIHFWESAQLLASPKYPWEYRLIGNCGSPLETPEGWLLLTHGVGPMRQYAIGAMLLDRDDPLQIRGRLRQPFLFPTEEEREGYVPNVVYSCGAMIHRNQLYIPYGFSDKFTGVATVHLPELLDRLLQSGR